MTSLETPYGAWLNYHCQAQPQLRVQYIPAERINISLLPENTPPQEGYAILDQAGYLTHVWDINEVDILLRAQAQSPSPLLRELLQLTESDRERRIQALARAKTSSKPSIARQELPSLEDLLGI